MTYGCEYGFLYGGDCEGAPPASDCGPHAEIIQKMMPRGVAYPRIKIGHFWETCCGLSPTFDRWLVACQNLNREIFPCSAVDMLPEWEESLGLPGVCDTNPPTTTEGRQDAVCAAFRSRFEEFSLDILLETLLGMGYPMRLDSLRKPFSSGLSGATELLQDWPDAWGWRGTSAGADTTVECTIARYCPSFTDTIFDFHSWSGWLTASTADASGGVTYAENIAGRYWLWLGDDFVKYSNSDSITNRMVDWTDVPLIPASELWVAGTYTGTTALIVANSGKIAQDAGDSSFAIVETSTSTLSAIDFDRTGNVGIAVGTSIVERSTDGGTSWVEVAGLTARPWRDIKFLGDSTWIAGGVSGYVIVSRDGGQTWLESKPTSATIFGFAINDAGLVVAAGGDLLMRSTDLVSWQTSTNPIPAETYFNIDYSIVGGFLAGGASTSLMAVSIDGISWTTITNPSTAVVAGSCQGIDTDDNGDWCAVFGSGATGVTAAIQTADWYHQRKRV